MVKRVLGLLAVCTVALGGGAAPARAACVPRQADQVEFPCFDVVLTTRVHLRLVAAPPAGGDVREARVTLDDPGRVTVAVVAYPKQTPVRTLAQAQTVAGELRLPWDGRDDRGRRVPDGAYVVRAQAVDPSPPRPVFTGDSDQAGLVLDRHAPRLRLDLPPRRGTTTPLRAEVVERVSGLREAVLRVDGRLVGRLGPGERRLRYRPRHAWRPGRHRVELRARDGAGNTARTVRRFTIA